MAARQVTYPDPFQTSRMHLPLIAHGLGICCAIHDPGVARLPAELVVVVLAHTGRIAGCCLLPHIEGARSCLIIGVGRRSGLRRIDRRR
jgi:hypothetical protein